MLLAVDETAWDSSCREHGTLLQSAVAFGIHMQWLHRGRVRLLLPAAPWLAPPAPSKQIGAEQLPSIDGHSREVCPAQLCFLGHLHQAHVLMEVFMNEAGHPAELHWGETSTILTHRAPQYSTRMHQRGCQSAPARVHVDSPGWRSACKVCFGCRHQRANSLVFEERCSVQFRRSPSHLLCDRMERLVRHRDQQHLHGTAPTHPFLGVPLAENHLSRGVAVSRQTGDPRPNSNSPAVRTFANTCFSKI